MVLVLVGGFYLFVGWAFRSQLRGTATPVEEIFETLIASPIPAAVTQLQGARSDSMQGYVAFVRFRAPSPSAAGLSSPPYDPVDCAEVVPQLVLPGFLDSPFVPEWAPPGFPEICLQTVGAREFVTGYVVYDDGWVHFLGSGD